MSWILCLLLASADLSSPEATVRSNFAALCAGDAEAYAATLASVDKDQEAALRSRLKGAAAGVRLEDVKVLEADGASARVRCVIVVSRPGRIDERQILEHQLVRRDSGWKIAATRKVVAP